MPAFIQIRALFLRVLPIVLCSAILNACGGGSDSTETHLAQLSSTSSSSSSSSDSLTVTLAGTVTYDYVPHSLNNIGLNYAATEKRSVRGAVIELLDQNGTALMSDVTGVDGSYSFVVPKNTLVKVRVKAELLKTTLPTWDFKVTDNTNGNALYVLDGLLVTSGGSDSKRNLHAASGWGSVSYTGARAAAPFAILDDIYIGCQRLLDAGSTYDLPPLELRWSTKNKAAEGDVTKGEIETSYYSVVDNSIYILGDANNDTDEYDSNVLLHEWGHYIESNLFRSDSIGGDHADEQILDMRVAMSEGFANAFSGMMLSSPNYSDASGKLQGSGFAFNLGKKTRSRPGFYSEGSVGSIFYNYYSSAIDKTANDFSPLFQVFTSTGFYNNDAMTSIFLFYAQLKQQKADQAILFNTLMSEQDIADTDEYATDETNNAGLAASLPLYKTLTPDNTATNVCSSPEFGKYNKLANSQFLKLAISTAGSYTFLATKAGGADVISKPEMIIYHKGIVTSYIKNTADDTASASVNLDAGNYVVEVYDVNNHDSKNTDPNTPCFNIRGAQN